MNKQAITSAFKNAGKVLKKHSPEILTGLGISGMILTTISAVKATPKALQLVDEKEIKDNKRLTKREIVATTWKCYIPAALTGVCSAACLIGANSINVRRNAALAAAYAISVQDLADYKKKALEVVGEKKERAIRDEIAKDKLKNDRVDTMPIISTGRGKVPCYDYLTKRLFESDMETLRKAENNLNKRLREEDYITLNEFFSEIGLEETDQVIGETLGWEIDHGYIDLDFTSQLVEGIPYLVLGHNNPPHYIKRY